MRLRHDPGVEQAVSDVESRLNVQERGSGRQVRTPMIMKGDGKKNESD
jgi:hypothetical protein